MPPPAAAAIYKPRSLRLLNLNHHSCRNNKLQQVAMEAAAPAPRARLAAMASAAVLVLLLAHAHGAAVSTPPTAAAAPAAVWRPWVARLQALHDLSISLSLDGVVGEQQGQGGFAECWGALLGLSSCSSEILLFFVSGESYIRPECCVAIRGATRYCWPAMLASVGFTAEEADVLRGFCDGEEAAAQHHHQQPAGATPPPLPELRSRRTDGETARQVVAVRV